MRRPPDESARAANSTAFVSYSPSATTPHLDNKANHSQRSVIHQFCPERTTIHRHKSHKHQIRHKPTNAIITQHASQSAKYHPLTQIRSPFLYRADALTIVIIRRFSEVRVRFFGCLISRFVPSQWRCRGTPPPCIPTSKVAFKEPENIFAWNISHGSTSNVLLDRLRDTRPMQTKVSDVVT